MPVQKIRPQMPARLENTKTFAGRPSGTARPPFIRTQGFYHQGAPQRSRTARRPFSPRRQRYINGATVSADRSITIFPIGSTQCPV